MDGMLPAVASEEVRAIVAHLGREFLRPLRSFRAELAAIADRSPDPLPVKDHEETMATVCDDLIAVTDAYYEFLCLTGDGHPFEPRPIRLGELRAEIDRRYGPRAGARSWSVQVEGPDEEIEADRATCLMALDRLVENAWAATRPDGEVGISLVASREDWRICIRDDGPGIPESERERVLEPFARLSRDVSAAMPGLGLGLSSSHALAARMGGALKIESREGGGTLVTIAFPRLREDAASPTGGLRRGLRKVPTDPIATDAPHC